MAIKESMPNLYKHISLEFMNQWPGQVYLRLEPYGGPAIMIRVNPGDIVAISDLGDPYQPAKRKTESEIRDEVIRELARMDARERSELLSRYLHPSADKYY